VLCARLALGALVPMVVRGAIAAGIGLAALSVVAAVYLHFGSPSREIVFWVGTVPGLALFFAGALSHCRRTDEIGCERTDGGRAAVLGSAALIVWQARFRPFDNGDCFGILVAATVIAFGVAISMVIRWRWVRASAMSPRPPQQSLTRRRCRAS